MTWQDYRWEEYRQDSTELYVYGDMKDDVTEPCTKATRDCWRAERLHDLDKRIQEHYRNAKYSIKRDSVFMASYDRLFVYIRTIPVLDDSNVTSKPCSKPIVSYVEYLDSLESKLEASLRVPMADSYGSIRVRGFTITSGMLADRAFEVLKPSDITWRSVYDDPNIEGSRIVSSRYKVGDKSFSITFKRREIDGPYIVDEVDPD
jgi:hypothetical protein